MSEVITESTGNEDKCALSQAVASDKPGQFRRVLNVILLADDADNIHYLSQSQLVSEHGHANGCDNKEFFWEREGFANVNALFGD